LFLKCTYVAHFPNHRDQIIVSIVAKLRQVNPCCPMSLVYLNVEIKNWKCWMILVDRWSFYIIIVD